MGWNSSWCTGLILIMVLGLTLGIEEVALQLNTKKWQHQVSEKFLSMSLDPAALLQGRDLRWSSARTLTLAKAMSPAYLRLAGKGSNYFLFQNEQDNNSISESDWVLLNNFCQITGVRLVAALNGMVRKDGVWDPRNCLTLIAFSDQMGFDLDWQLGYELQRVPVPGGGAQWGRDVLALRHILDAFPRYAHSAVVAPDITYFRTKEDAEFLKNFFEIAGPALAAITWHPNFAEPSASSDSSSADSEEADFLEAQPDTLSLDNEVLGRLLARITPRKPLWIAESHTESARGQDTFAGALQWAQRLGVAARLGIQVLFRQPDVRGIMQPSPDYWVSLLHKRLVGREVFDSRLVTGNRTHISVFCHCTRDMPGAITLFGANILHHRVRIAVKGSTLGLGDMMSMDQYTLTEYQGHTLLNGALLGLSPEEELPVLTPRVRHVPRSLTLSMPAQSIVFWVLPEARVRACEESQPQPVSLLKIKSRKSNALQDDSSEESDDMGFFDKDASQSIEKYIAKSPLAKVNNIRERKYFVGIDFGNNKENNMKIKNNQNMNNEHLLKLNLGSYDNLFHDQENNRTVRYSQDSLEQNIAEAIRLLQRGVEKHSAALKTDRSKFYEDRIRDSNGEAWFSRDNKRESGYNLKENSEPQHMGVEKSEAGKLSDVESDSDSSLKLQVKPLVKDEILIPNMKKAEKYLQSMFISLMEDNGVNSTEEVTEHSSDGKTLERSKRSVLGLTPNKTPVMADPGWRRWRQRWNKKSRLPLTKSHEAMEEDESDSFPEGDVYVSEIGGADSHQTEYTYIDDDDDDDGEDFLDHDDLDEDEFGYFDDLEGTHFFNAEFFENMDYTTPVVDNQFDGDEELWEVDFFPSEIQKETLNTSGGNSDDEKAIYMHTLPVEEALSGSKLSQGLLSPHQQVAPDTRGHESEIKSKVRDSGRSHLNGGMNMLRYKQGEDIKSNENSEKMMYSRNHNNNAELFGNANGFEIRPGQGRNQMYAPSHTDYYYNSNNNVPHRWYNTYMQSYPLHSTNHLAYAQVSNNQDNPVAQHYKALRNKQNMTLRSPKRVAREIPTDVTEQLKDTHNSTEDLTEINRDMVTTKYTADNDTHQSDIGVSNSQLNTKEMETRTDLQESSRIDNQFNLRNAPPEFHKMEAESAGQESERSARATMEKESLKEPDNSSALAESSRTATSNLLEDLVKDKVTLNDLLPQNIKKQIKIMEEKGEESDLKIVDNGNQTQDIKYIPADNDDRKEENSTKQEQLEPESTTCALEEVEEARVPDPKTARRLALQRKREQRLETLKNAFRSRKRKRDLNRNRNYYIPAYDYLDLLWPSDSEKVRLVDDDRFPTQGNGNNFQYDESIPSLPSILTLKYRTQPTSDILPVKTYLGEMLAEPDSNIIYNEKKTSYQRDNQKMLNEPSEHESSGLGVITYKQDSPQIRSLFHELQQLEEDDNIDDDYISYLADYVSELKLLKELIQRSENPSFSKFYDQMLQQDTSSMEREKAPEMDEYRTAQIYKLSKKVPGNVLTPQNSNKPLQHLEGIGNILKLVKYNNNREYQDRDYDEHHPLSSFKEETDPITSESIQSKLYEYNNQVSSTNKSHNNLNITTETTVGNKNDATGFRSKRSVELITTEANSERTDSKSNLSDYRKLNDENILNELAYKLFPLSQEKKKKQVKMPQKGGDLSQSSILLGDPYSRNQMSSDEFSDENISEDENIIPDEGHEKERLIKFYKKNVIPFDKKHSIQNDGERHNIDQQKHVTHKKDFVNVENQRTIKSMENKTDVQSDHNIESNESVAVTDRDEGITESKGTSDNETLLNDKSDLENKIEITLNKDEKASDHIQIVNKNSNREGNGGFFQTVLGKLKSVLGVIRSFASSAFIGN